MARRTFPKIQSVCIITARGSHLSVDNLSTAFRAAKVGDTIVVDVTDSDGLTRLGAAFWP